MRLIKSIVSVALLAGLAGCEHLRSGWVKVDFLEGEPAEMMVCKLKLQKDDLTAVCVSVETALRKVREGAALDPGI